MTNIWDLFNEEEERLLEEGRAEIAAKDAAWQALPQAERDRINAEREAKWDALFSGVSDDEQPDDDDDDEDDDDEDEDEDEEQGDA
jgi:hypothetical protein